MIHVNQFEMHILGPSYRSGVPEFANRAEIGSCDTSDLIWSFETISIIAWLQELLEVEVFEHNVLEAEILGGTTRALNNWCLSSDLYNWLKLRLVKSLNSSNLIFLNLSLIKLINDFLASLVCYVMVNNILYILNGSYDLWLFQRSSFNLKNGVPVLLLNAEHGSA